MEYEHTLIVTIDGVKVFEDTIGGEEDIEGDRSAAGAGRRRDQRPVQEHPGQGDGRPAQGRRRRSSRGRYAESDDVLLQPFRPGGGEDRMSRRSAASRSTARSIRPA